jgi:hypothetical protein
VSTDEEMLERILRTISSGYDLRLAMKSQMVGADRERLLMFMRVSASMGSNHDLGSFLLEAAPYYLGKDRQLEDAWLNAAQKIGSSHERKLALTGVLDYAQGNVPVTLGLINAIKGMSSGADKAEVLTAMAKRKIISTPELRAAFLTQVSTLSSTVDKRTVLEAL